MERYKIEYQSGRKQIVCCFHEKKFVNSLDEAKEFCAKIGLDVENHFIKVQPGRYICRSKQSPFYSAEITKM